MSVLFLTSESPYPPSGGGKLRDAQMIRLLREREMVDVLCFETASVLPDESQDENVSFITRDRPPIWKRVLYPMRPYVVNGYSRRMEAALRERAEPNRILWISRLAMAQYIPLARSLGYRVILDEHNVESSILMNAAVSSMRHWPETLIAAQCAYYEEKFCESSHAVVATSEIDASRLHRIAPKAPIHVIPNAIDSPTYAPLREKAGTTLFFPGTLNYYPNIEGLHWFAYEVLPRLRATLGDQTPRVVVAGANPSDDLLVRLGNQGVEVIANPPSILPHLQDAAVVFVPIRSGGGTRLKILEAMAAGRPVVSTGKGAEGLVLAPFYDICIADQADTFTSSIARLLRDPALRLEMGERAAKTVSERYDWRCARPMIEQLLVSVSLPKVSVIVP